MIPDVFREIRERPVKLALDQHHSCPYFVFSLCEHKNIYDNQCSSTYKSTTYFQCKPYANSLLTFKWMFSSYFEQFALSTVSRFVFACLAHSSKTVFSVIYKSVPIILTYRLKFDFNMTYAVKPFVKKKCDTALAH